MTTKRQIIIVVRMVDTNANPPVAAGRINALGLAVEWRASMGKVPIVEFEQLFPKWATPSLKDAVLGAIGRANVPVEVRSNITEPL